MLKKKYRLPSDVRLGRAKTITAKSFVLKTAVNSLSYPRFAFVISKKVDRRAVVRNRIKRKLSGSIEPLIGSISSGIDMVFILKRSAIENIEKIGHEIEDEFVKQGLLL